MSRDASSPPDTGISAAINLDFVRNLIESGNGDGTAEVEAFHRSIFLHRNGRDLEHFRQQRLIGEDRLADLEPRLDRVRSRLAQEEQHVAVLENGVPDQEPSALWNLWDRVMFWLAAMGVLSLLVFGVFNISFNLLESGIVTFSEHPVRAYFWAALLPVGALAVKVGWDSLESLRLRRMYLWTCLALGVAAVLVWVAAYASVYPALSITTGERITHLSVHDSGADGGALSELTRGGVKRIDMIIVAAQALAEICLSAALGIYMTQLYGRHRPVRLARNPRFLQLDQERQELEERISMERMALAAARGNECRLENELAGFVAYARSLFRKEVALRRDRGHQKRQILDQISEHLKARLAEADRDGDGKDETLDDAGRLALHSK